MSTPNDSNDSNSNGQQAPNQPGSGRPDVVEITPEQAQTDAQVPPSTHTPIPPVQAPSAAQPAAPVTTEVTTQIVPPTVEPSVGPTEPAAATPAAPTQPAPPAAPTDAPTTAPAAPAPVATQPAPTAPPAPSAVPSIKTTYTIFVKTLTGKTIEIQVEDSEDEPALVQQVKEKVLEKEGYVAKISPSVAT